MDIVNKLSKDYDITIFTIYANGELEKEVTSKVKLKSLYNVPYQELSKVEKNFKMETKEYLENYQESFRSMTSSEKIAFLEKEKEFWEQEKKLEKNETPELDIHKELGEKKI